MRLACIIQLGPKCHHKCPCEREKKGNNRHTEEEKRLERCGHKPRNGSHQSVGEAGARFSPLGLRPAGFQTSSLQHREGVNTVTLCHLVCGRLSQQPRDKHVIQERGPLRAGQTAQPRGLTVWPEENCSFSRSLSRLTSHVGTLKPFSQTCCGDYLVCRKHSGRPLLLLGLSQEGVLQVWPPKQPDHHRGLGSHPLPMSEPKLGHAQESPAGLFITQVAEHSGVPHVSLWLDSSFLLIAE